MSCILKMRKLWNSLVPVGPRDQDLMELIAANEEVFVEIKVLSKRDIRRGAQNSLYWMWLTDLEKTTINEHAGRTKDEWHFQFKKDFLIRIYERDDPMTAATLESLRTLYKNNGKEEATNVATFLIKKAISTTDAKIKQFSEYLNEIERFSHMNGISLRTDNDTYMQALYGK